MMKRQKNDEKGKTMIKKDKKVIKTRAKGDFTAFATSSSYSQLYFVISSS